MPIKVMKYLYPYISIRPPEIIEPNMEVKVQKIKNVIPRSSPGGSDSLLSWRIDLATRLEIQALFLLMLIFLKKNIF
jgi:hypothetical protein